MNEHDEDIIIVPEPSAPPDVLCERIPPERMNPASRTRVSIPQYVVQHSPTGFEWGYNGAGPADLALNVLHMHLPPGCDGEEPLKLYRGACSQVAWALHQAFKRHFISFMPDAGGVIRSAEVAWWIAARWTREGGYSDPRHMLPLRPGESPDDPAPGTMKQGPVDHSYPPAEPGGRAVDRPES